MNISVCPRCGAQLIEDAWESICESHDGDTVIDAYPAYVCGNNCGYVKRIETNA